MNKRWPPNEAIVGVPAGDVMSYVDQMIKSAPNKAEAERRLAAVIAHATARWDNLSTYWLDVSREEKVNDD